MPRYTLHRPKHLPHSLTQDSQKSPVPESAARETEAQDEIPKGLRCDARVKIIDEAPRLLLIESTEEAAAEWHEQMPGWKMQKEQRAKMPDPRPRLK